MCYLIAVLLRCFYELPLIKMQVLALAVRQPATRTTHLSHSRLLHPSTPLAVRKCCGSPVNDAGLQWRETARGKSCLAEGQLPRATDKKTKK